MNHDEARSALDGIDHVQREFALNGTQYPLWRHAAFGLVMGLLVLGQGLGLGPKMALFAVAMAGCAWLVTDDRRRYGLFVNGYRKGRTLPLTLALLVIVLAAMAAEVRAYSAGWPLAPKLGIAAAVFAVALAASVLWTRIYRRELLDGGATK